MFGWLPANEIAAGLMLLGVVPAAGIIRYIWPERRKPAVVWFICLMITGIGWAVTAGLNLLLEGTAISLALFRLNALVLGLGAVCWLFLTIEYTSEVRLSARAFLTLAVVPLCLQLFLWTDPGLFYTVSEDVENGIRINPEPGWFVTIGYNYLLAVLGTGMWIGEWFSADETRRRQAELFLLWIVVLLCAGVLFSLAVLSPASTPAAAVLGPIGFVFAGGIIAYALTEYQLFQLAPVARETVVEEMDDGVIIFDGTGQVVDANPAARQLFGFDHQDGKMTDLDATALFETYPELAAQLETSEEVRTEISLDFDGVERDLDLNITSIEYGRGSPGKVVAFRDITSLKQRERDLALLKRTLTRVFRHNVRNDMAAIRGYAETITHQADGAVADHAEHILDQSDELIEQSKKARLIADVIDADEAVQRVDLHSTVEQSCQRYREQYPEATLTSSVPAGTTVHAHRSLGHAVDQLVENALVHHDGTPTVTVSTTVDGQRTGLVVEDDGAGIPQEEIGAVFHGEESELFHGSGVGLRLANWIAEYSGGELTLENTGSGSRGIIWLQRAEKEG